MASTASNKRGLFHQQYLVLNVLINYDTYVFQCTLHQSNPECLKSGSLIDRQSYWKKLVRKSFLGKMIDIELRDFFLVTKKLGCCGKFGC